MNNPGTYIDNWIGGVNSGSPPFNAGRQEIAWLENCMIRGGYPCTRPGMLCLSSFVGFVPQGICSFVDKGGTPYLVIAVDGLIYASAAPFKAFSKIDNIAFSPTALIVNFQSCIKAVQANADGTKTIIAPTPVLIIQDNSSPPAAWDGTAAKQLDPSAAIPETPTGLWMAWASDRLWVFRGSQGYVSDIDDPEHFTENVYLAQRSNFALPDDCTGVVQTSDQQTLLAFTDTTTTAFQSNIRDRTTWQSTPNFQRIILPELGCVSGRSVANQYGVAQWYSRRGLVSLDGALYDVRTTRVTVKDWQMQRSKSQLAPDMSGIAVATFDNLILVSAPVADKWNSETWVMDQTPQAQGANLLQEVWAGVWTGTRPVAWAKLKQHGRERIFFLSYDKSSKDATHIHLWEAFRGIREDNDGRIQCQFETVCLKEDILMDFRYCELDICELLGEVDLQVYVGGLMGRWIKILDTHLSAEEGPVDAVTSFSSTHVFESYKPQNRSPVRTNEFTTQDKEAMAESVFNEGTDKCYQILVQWRGQMAVRGIRIVAKENDKQGDQGRIIKASEAGQTNIVTERGETVKT